jgi:hypothetical protein
VSLRPQCEYARHRQAAGMADAEPPSGHPQGLGGLGRASDELDFRCGARRAVDHDIGERDARAEASAERLEHRLLGGEPPGQALDAIGAVADFLKFPLHEAARNQRIARIFDPAPQLSNLNEVDSMPDYIHACQRAPNRLPKPVPQLNCTSL